jgi:hypothetical protein
MVIKSRRMRWAWHVAHMGRGEVAYRVLVGKPEGMRPLGTPKQILKRCDGRAWTGLIRLRLGMGSRLLSM